MILQLSRPDAEMYIPDGTDPQTALSRTTHLCIAAHPDDVEVMAVSPVLECFGSHDRWFTAVIATDGAASPRSGPYLGHSNEQMRLVRKLEQKKAAHLGEYSAVVFLNHTSADLKSPLCASPRADLASLFQACRPQVAFTHNPADKHDTHVAVVLRTIAAIRELPRDARPAKLVGCEVWRDLDWLADSAKVPLPVHGHDNIAAALMGAFDSQIAGGKRYDLAVQGRRRANASFYQSHHVDTYEALNFGIDLTPMLECDNLEVRIFIQEHIRRFEADVMARLARL
jgi:LmbE family N-acetylglucosaminyl deacetylase